MTLAAAALLISCDLYYRSLLHPPAVANTDPQPPTAEGPARGETPATQTPRLSWRQGLADLTWVNPFGLSSVETVTALFWQRADHLRGWDRQGPTQVLTIGIWLLSLLALIGLLPRNSRGAAARDPLVRFLLAGVAIWFGLKYLMTFALSSLSRTHYDLMMLAVYMHYLLLRCELLLLFAFLAAASARLFLAHYPLRTPRPVTAAAVAVCWLLPALGLAAGVEVSGFPTIPTTDRFEVSRDDLKLSAWLDDHVPPEKGTIGLAAFTFTVGPHDEEHHLYPLGGGHALALYGRHYNFRFFLPALEGDGGAAYQEHVSDGTGLPETVAGAMGMMGSPFAPAPLLGAAALLPRRNRGFDANWCLRNSIRYFYATPKALSRNPGLAWAVAGGQLRPVVQFGDSILYEVRP